MDLLTPLRRPFPGEIQPGGRAGVFDRRPVMRPGRIDLLREMAEEDGFPLEPDFCTPLVPVFAVAHASEPGG